ncbi:MAG TPA: HlyD family efflux transporter periplasmic adaptor subunit [Mucilaginibacter sp.]|jgi:HlyD family secretion protein
MEEETTIIENEKVFFASKTISNKINHRSELAQEIISRKPDFTEKWALFIFLGILLLMLVASWFIKYPDIIEAKASLTAKNAPKEIIPRQDGHLVRLFVHNNDQVSKAQMIGWLESTGSHQEVIDLSKQIDSSIALLNLNRVDKVSKMFDKHYSNLGELQQGYQQFISAWQQFNDYMVNGFYQKKKNLLENDVSSLNKTNQTLNSQKELAEQDVKLAEETFNMNKTLSEEKVLTREEFRVQKSRYVNKLMTIPQLNASLLANETQKRDKIKEIDELDHALAQEKIIFDQALQSLKSQVDDWMKKNILQSPVSGRVSFIIPLQENQYLRAGTLMGYINPSDSHFYAEANLSQLNFGKIDTGLSVQLRFDAYPYQEMGFVEGKLDYISSVPSDSGFLATVRLDKGLITNDRKHIPYKNGLKAQAIIITQNMRLADRLYYNMIKSTSVGK